MEGKKLLDEFQENKGELTAFGVSVISKLLGDNDIFTTKLSFEDFINAELPEVPDVVFKFYFYSGLYNSYKETLDMSKTVKSLFDTIFLGKKDA